MATFIERPRNSCALGGALTTLNALQGVIPIIHASNGCGGNICGTIMAGSGYQGGGYIGALSVPSSNVSEKEILFGGEERLEEQVAATLELVDGQVYVIVTGCMTEIIGDDAKAVARRFQQQGKPVFAAETAGFKGNAYHGYDLLLEALIREGVVGPKGVEKEPHQVNLWGIVPGHDPFWRGDLLEIKRLLGLLGLQVSTFIAPDETADNLRQASKAAGNIIVSQSYGVAAAKVFEEEYGTPFLAVDLPVGPTATADFLRQVGRFLGLETTKVEEVIRREDGQYYWFIERLADFYTDLDMQHYAVVVSNANYSAPIARFLADDLGWLPEVVVVTEPLAEEQKAHIQEALAGLAELKDGQVPKVLFETDPYEIHNAVVAHWPKNNGEKYAHKLSPAFVIGSSFEKDLAAAIGARHLTVSFPILDRVLLDRGYSGYNGALHLVEDLLAVVVGGR
ncbi:nitrogenase component 1 [Heliophilum fasciatum]|uniref:Nitrogenase molybdenum-iron protein beta chain n=1 Tax=Heliophilum fasciatum TaxID=35700 RepID=A0A4R2RRF4_9FIRM|nr:nitrogenase component 1 [Heliophilum fasciatum]MCW2277690.1 nitrogenase molybdenum-iron protein beta chain [Heliophilum fasciatum]TCP65037.1 nitrogenase molybdenum-iron protein beta chain [Heliophilum fasciatum]